jgi:hypothetical protein
LGAAVEAAFSLPLACVALLFEGTFFFAVWRAAVEVAISLPLAGVALLFEGVFFLVVFVGAILNEGNLCRDVW